jgi:hypothetical protein
MTTIKCTRRVEALRSIPDILPDKLSDLLDLAVNDALKVSKLKKFKLNMGDWLETYDDGNCNVCLAGSVMAGTLKVRTNNAYPSQFGLSVSNKLDFLNTIRIGSIHNLFGPYYGLRTHSAVKEAFQLIEDDFTYRDNGRAQWNTYRKAAKILRAAGL